MGFALGGIAVAGLASAYMGSQASQSAANTQANAANNAAGISQAEFNTEQANNAPYLQAGDQALGTLQGDMPSLNSPFTTQDFQQSPGYQFQLQQGLGAIQASAAARGLSNSTGTMANMNNYAQGAANTDYQQAFNNYQTQNSATFNHLATVAGMGQAAAVNSNSAAQATGAQIGSDITGAANASAAGTIGTANAIGGGLSTAGNGVMTASVLNNLGANNYQNMPVNGYSMPTVGSSAIAPAANPGIGAMGNLTY